MRRNDSRGEEGKRTNRRTGEEKRIKKKKKKKKKDKRFLGGKREKERKRRVSDSFVLVSQKLLSGDQEDNRELPRSAHTHEKTHTQSMHRQLYTAPSQHTHTHTLTNTHTDTSIYIQESTTFTCTHTSSILQQSVCEDQSDFQHPD